MWKCLGEISSCEIFFFFLMADFMKRNIVLIDFNTKHF